MKKFTSEEKDRLCEILFYKYFENKDAAKLGDAVRLANCVNAFPKLSIS